MDRDTMINDEFEKEQINPIVGELFHSGWRLGSENAPRSMDWQYLKQGTTKIKVLLEAQYQQGVADERSRWEARLAAAQHSAFNESLVAVKQLNPNMPRTAVFQMGQQNTLDKIRSILEGENKNANGIK